MYNCRGAVERKPLSALPGHDALMVEKRKVFMRVALSVSVVVGVVSVMVGLCVAL